MLDVKSLIGDVDLLKPVLDGFFGEWKGTYELYLYEQQEYLFNQKQEANQYCEEIRKSAEGTKRCLECDRNHADISIINGQPIHYICHGGLIDVASPIIVNDKCLAVVFCGQRKPFSKSDIEKAKNSVIALENYLHIPLYDFWNLSKDTSVESIIDLEKRMSNLCKYLSEQWKKQLNLI